MSADIEFLKDFGFSFDESEARLTVGEADERMDVVVFDSDTGHVPDDATVRFRAVVFSAELGDVPLALDTEDVRDVVALAVAVQNDDMLSSSGGQPESWRSFFVEKENILVTNAFCGIGDDWWKGRETPQVFLLENPAKGKWAEDYVAWREDLPEAVRSRNVALSFAF